MFGEYSSLFPISSNTSEILSEGTFLILFKCESLLPIILINLVMYDVISPKLRIFKRGRFGWQSHSPILHKKQGQNFQPGKSVGFRRRISEASKVANKSTVLSRYMIYTVSIHRIHIRHDPLEFFEVRLLGMNRRDCSPTDHSTSSTSL